MQKMRMDTAFLYANRHFIQVFFCFLVAFCTFDNVFSQDWNPFLDFTGGLNLVENGPWNEHITQNGILKINKWENTHSEVFASRCDRVAYFGRLTLHPLPLLGIGFVGGSDPYKIGYHDDNYLASHGLQYQNNSNQRWRHGIVIAQKNYYTYGPSYRLEIAGAEIGCMGLFFSRLQHVVVGSPEYYFNKFDQSNNELLMLKSKFKEQFVSNTIGFDYIYGTHKFYLGMIMQYEWSDEMMSADYTFTKDNLVKYTDHFSTGINQWSWMFVGGLSLAEVEKFSFLGRRQNTFYHNINILGDIANERVRVDSTDSHLVIQSRDTAGLAKTGTIKRVQQTMQLYDTALNIGLWDYDRVDDDTVTVLLNGKIIAENVALGSKIQKFHVRMPRGENTLVVLFISQGKMKPCTCELLIYPRKKRVPQKFLLNSGKHNAVSIKIKNEHKSR